MLGAVSEFDKAMLVAKLRGARQRKRATGVKVEGRKSVAEREGGAEAVALARKLHGARKRRPSLRDIAAELAKAGHVAKSGKPFSSSVVARMLGDY